MILKCGILQLMEKLAIFMSVGFVVVPPEKS